MCGIAGIIGTVDDSRRIDAMVSAQAHRGPDATGTYRDPQGKAVLGHNRLSIIDLSEAGSQPMVSRDGRCVIVFNGEIYNYKELKSELSGYPFRTQTDTEVILAAFEKWGEHCLDHFLGMFAFLLWDTQEQRLFAARDRFGVKPLYYGYSRGTLLLASEIKALHAAGVAKRADETAWATYLAAGVYDHSPRTFWEGVSSLPAGHQLVWEGGKVHVSCWYDLADRVRQKEDTRGIDVVSEEYFALLCESVRLRFRADVPVGINLSGGLDSSVLLGVVDREHPDQKSVQAFTFVTGDERYDESPWVEQMLRGTGHPWMQCLLRPEQVPALALQIQSHQDEPFGGMPTIAYSRVFAEARRHGTIVLLDGQGMDEQWAGYDYYRSLAEGKKVATVQGAQQPSTQPGCLRPSFLARAESVDFPQPFPDLLRNLQYRDTRYTKIPRALRFNDRVSMESSTELREPFLDHRLFELAFAQPHDRKIADGTGKWLLRSIAKRMLPQGVVDAPKRPLQTPQREWLREDLREWASRCIEQGLTCQPGDWLDPVAVRNEWKRYLAGESDNSFYVWQWMTIGLMFGA